MSDSAASLRRKISSAGELQSVVRTMKALAASSIGQYERSVSALRDYHQIVELGLGACFRENRQATSGAKQKHNPEAGEVGAVIFGSDQGLVGQFNEVIADYAIKALAALPGKPKVWAVGERVCDRLTEAGLAPIGLFPVPNSVSAITPLVGQIQVKSEAHRARGDYAQLYVFHNRPQAGALFQPVALRLLPLDADWAEEVARVPWPNHCQPEIVGGDSGTLRAFIREYLFLSLFRACAESLASENASRLAAMQRADKNIDDRLESFQRTFHRMRQTGIDEELFDVTSGFEALNQRKEALNVHRAGDAPEQ